MTETPHRHDSVVLASSSPYRRALLARVGIPHEVDSPHVDETPAAGEDPETLVARLASAKVDAVAERHPRALVVGSDQVAVLDGRILGKPGGHDANVAQLAACSGRWVRFVTSICVLNGVTGRKRVEIARFGVKFRALGAAQIESYVRREQAYDCAGGFRSESLGGALFERMEGDDPNSLVGLPLFRLVAMLGDEGFDVLLHGEP